jgi:flagellar hook assembly protein FlgD
VLKAEVDDLKERIRKLEALLVNRSNVVTAALGFLEQNSPNPVSGITTIRYHVPEPSTSARLTITNAKGQVVKAVAITNRGTGKVNLNTAGLAAGTYTYTLYVDGKTADSKRLMVAR